MSGALYSGLSRPCPPVREVTSVRDRQSPTAQPSRPEVRALNKNLHHAFSLCYLHHHYVSCHFRLTALSARSPVPDRLAEGRLPEGCVSIHHTHYVCVHGRCRLSGCERDMKLSASHKLSCTTVWHTVLLMLPHPNSNPPTPCTRVTVKDVTPGWQAARCAQL
jgi:hypothetical protein